VIALTKRDLVDDEWLEIATLEVADHVGGTFLDGAPIVPVASIDGDGLDELASSVAHLHAIVLPVLRVGEIDAAFGIDGQVIGLIEALAVVLIRENGNAAITLDASNSAVARFAHNQAAFEVEEQSVGSCLLAEDLDFAIDAASRDVAATAEVEAVTVGAPGRTFAGADVAVVHWLRPRRDRRLRGQGKAKYCGEHGDAEGAMRGDFAVACGDCSRHD
jgi:hypothetical protein